REQKGRHVDHPDLPKHDRVAFRESPEVEGTIVEWWKRGFSSSSNARTSSCGARTRSCGWPQRISAVRAHRSRVAGEPRGLWRPQSVEAAPARRAGRRPLYSGAPDAAPGPRGRGARTEVHGDDDPGSRDSATAGSGDAAVHGRAAEPAWVADLTYIAVTDAG